MNFLNVSLRRGSLNSCSLAVYFLVKIERYIQDETNANKESVRGIIHITNNSLLDDSFLVTVFQI